MWLLVSDVDHTLVGEDEALRRFWRSAQATPELLVALNSSRPCASVQQTLARLPVRVDPVAIIGAMGTELYEGGKMLEAWTRRFASWSRAPVDALMADLGFERHPEEFQTPFKASYAVPGERRDEVAAVLREEVPAVRIIASGASDFDVLPPQAGKGAATVFLARHLGVPHDHLIVAGDSANDAQLFDVARKGIVVGNARDELRRWVNPETAYLARGAYADGLLEGLRHWGVPLNEIETAP